MAQISTSKHHDPGGQLVQLHVQTFRREYSLPWAKTMKKKDQEKLNGVEGLRTSLFLGLLV